MSPNFLKHFIPIRYKLYKSFYYVIIDSHGDPNYDSDTSSRLLSLSLPDKVPVLYK